MRGCPDCPRGLKTCLPLDNSVSDDEGPKSFTCVGLNDGSDREIVGDYLTLCTRAGLGIRADRAGEFWAIDTRDHVDRLDLGDQASVISSALVMDERISATDVGGAEIVDNYRKFKVMQELADEEEDTDGKDTS